MEKANLVFETVKKALGDKIPDLDLKLKEQIELFKNSEAVVVCEDCATIFYCGKAETVAMTREFVDWKMLATRHVWDTQHKVVVFLPYFSMSMFPLSKFTEYIDPNDNTKILYYKQVEKHRENRPDRAKNTFDQNWDVRSRCYCSVCFKGYYNPKDACMCHMDMKPYLPMSEVNTIMVKQ